MRNRPVRAAPQQSAEVSPHALGGLGDAIARLTEGQTVLVADAVPGDRLLVQLTPGHKGLLRATIVDVLQPSPHRVTPLCPVFATCGGCTWQHIDRAMQLDEKRKFVQHAIGQSVAGQGVDVTGPLAVVADWRHRRRVRFHLRRQPKQLAAGMMARHSHDLAPTSDCVVLTEALARVLGALPKLAERWLVQGEVYAVEGLEGVVAVIHGPAPSPGKPPSAETLAAQLRVQGLTLSLGRHHDHFGLTEVTLPEAAGPLPVTVDAQGFCQAAQAANVAIRSAVVAALDTVGPVPKIQEFYAGSGNLSVLCAGRAPIIRTLEHDVGAVTRARKTLAADTQSVWQVLAGDAEERLEPAQLGELWLLDPGRQGAKGVVESAVELGPRHIIYVSCAMDTLRRDVTTLTNAGYVVQSAEAIDAFVHTPHVEAVVHLSHPLR